MVQSVLLNTWGGRRPGAGRPRLQPRPVSHLARPRLPKGVPVHVTAKLRPLPSLRRGIAWKVVRAALVAGCARPGFRVVEFSVQSNHLHLLCEADDRPALSRGLQGLFIRIAHGLNEILGRSGTVFRERYFEHILRTPREARNALAYVLNNARKHRFFSRRERYRWDWTDPCSSAPRFFGLPGAELALEWLPRARSWLLRVGVARAGPITIDEVPSERSG